MLVYKVIIAVYIKVSVYKVVVHKYSMFVNDFTA